MLYNTSAKIFTNNMALIIEGFRITLHTLSATIYIGVRFLRQPEVSALS